MFELKNTQKELKAQQSHAHTHTHTHSALCPYVSPLLSHSLWINTAIDSMTHRQQQGPSCWAISCSWQRVPRPAPASLTQPLSFWSTLVLYPPVVCVCVRVCACVLLAWEKDGNESQRTYHWGTTAPPVAGVGDSPGDVGVLS